MSHHKNKIKIDSCGTEIRLRRDRRSSRPALTKGSRCDRAPLPNPDPDGGKPSTAWVLNFGASAGYPKERKRRRQRALDKQRERRAILRSEKRQALAEEES